MQPVYILSGIPGSGKSTFAQRITSPERIVSVDDWFTDDRGVYTFEPSRVRHAHQACKREFIRHLMADPSVTDTPIVVDNTNTTLLQMAFYVEAADAAGRDTHLVCFHCSIETAKRRNVHEVPQQTIARMYAQMQVTWSGPALREAPRHWYVKAGYPSDYD